MLRRTSCLELNFFAKDQGRFGFALKGGTLASDWVKDIVVAQDRLKIIALMVREAERGGFGPW